MKPVLLCACLFALALGGCSLFTGPGSSGERVIAQAQPGGEVAFDVVKVDPAVLATLHAHREPPFHTRFKKYVPPPELKIAAGDIVSVRVWEAASGGLFGNDLRREFTSNAGSIFRQLDSGRSGGRLTPEIPAGAGRIQAAVPEAGGRVPAAAPAPLPPGMALLDTLGGPRPLPGDRLTGAPFLQPPTPARDGSLQSLVAASMQQGLAGTQIPPQLVGADGAISVPYAGRVPAEGRTPGEVQRDVEARLADKAIDPQALVIVQRSFANSVSVTGEAIAGRRVTLTPGGVRLLDVIAEAGGARGAPHEIFVRLSRQGVTATVPLAMLIANPEENIYARPGDVLTLVRRPQSFSVFGAVAKNAAITFNRDRLLLSEALALAGGLADERADPRAVFLFRYEPASLVRALGQPLATKAPPGISPIAYRFDLRDPNAYLLARRFPVRDKDIIFVANAEVEPLYRFFAALSNITGPIQSFLVVCNASSC